MRWMLTIWLCTAFASCYQVVQDPQPITNQDGPTNNQKAITIISTIEDDINKEVKQETGETSQPNNATIGKNENNNVSNETATTAQGSNDITQLQVSTTIEISPRTTRREHQISTEQVNSSKEINDYKPYDKNQQGNSDNGQSSTGTWGVHGSASTSTVTVPRNPHLSTLPELDEEYPDEPLDSGFVDRQTGNAEVSDVISTEGGPVQGILDHQDLEIRSYLDIPYGQFSHPFKAPTKAAPWEAVHDVRQHNKRCPQLDTIGGYIGSFDCLTLSVFAPRTVGNLPVLFHIHDGQFQNGSANPSIYGPQYLATKGIILVLPNYRLGPLGFLSLQNDIAPGNAALKDLALALKWTKNNIEEFGGNASNIVVSGEGMAGALAGYLALASKSRDDIGGVITESGSVLAHWAIDRNPLDTAQEIADLIKDELTESELEELLIAARNLTFRPCVENGTDAFLDKTPWEILDSDNKIDIAFMIGSANHAGMHEAVRETSESLSQLDGNFSQFFPNDLEFKSYEEKIEVSENVRKAYFSNKSIDVDALDKLILCYTDAYYMSPAIRFSRALVDAGAKVFFYEFSFVGLFNRELIALSPNNQTGAARGDIVGYTFMQDMDVPLQDSEEERVIEMVTDLWISFIKTRNPSAEEVTWNQFQKSVEGEEEYLSIALQAEPQKGLHVERLTLWTEIYRDHFLERNLAIQLASSLQLLILAALLMIASPLCN